MSAASACKSLRAFWSRLRNTAISYRCRNRNLRFLQEFDPLKSSFASMETRLQLEQVFKVIDLDGDGKISPSELGSILLTLGHNKSATEDESKKMVREMDVDGDGLIDLEEFIRTVLDSMGRDGEDGLLEAFLIFDRDKDGLISADDLRRVMVQLGFNKCSLRESKRMIRGVDRDGDGHVSFHEFRCMMVMNNNHGSI